MKKLLRDNSIVILFLMSALAVLFIAIYSGTLMTTTSEMLVNSTEGRLLAVARSATGLVSAEELAQLQTEEDMEKPLYDEIKQRLAEFSQESDVMYTYYMRDVGDGQYQFIIDNDYDPEWMVGLASEPVDAEPAPQSAMGGEPAVAGVGDYSVDWDGILAAYAPVTDDAGNVVAIVGVDISDENIVQTRNNMKTLSYTIVAIMAVVMVSGFIGFWLYKRKARLSESANVAKSQFLSRMSHEIRTPLNAIIGLCGMAKRADDQNELNCHLDNIAISSTHLLHLINDILDLSKIEEGKLELDVVPSRTRDELDKIATIMAPQIMEKRQSFSVNIAPGVPEYVYCDNTHLRQIIVNLLSNAVKFTPVCGKVALYVRLLEQREDNINFEFTVKDSGIGIAPEYRDKLFDPFEQGDGGTTRKYGGSGLGLAITKQLVELMGGHISVDSAPGEGSVFTFNVWLKKAPDSEEILALEEETPPPDLTGLCILLVEDSEINRMIAEDLFLSYGALVDTAADGQEGLDMYLEDPGRYDLIFMDIQMPRMDGYEATKSIRCSGAQNAATVPIIAMTANVFKEDVEKALDCGMNRHVGKPFEACQVARAIRDVIPCES